MDRVEFSDLSLSACPQELHVLAVDDSPVDRTMIERMLKRSACKVTTVDSGTRALQYLGLEGNKGFQGLKVNLIVTDYSMPGMTGYELLKRIKESSDLKGIPAVILSSENILPRIDRCLHEGAEAFLLKPVKLSDMKRLKDLMKQETTTTVVNKRKPEGDRLVASPLSVAACEQPCSSPLPKAVSCEHQQQQQQPCSSPLKRTRLQEITIE